MDDPNASAQDGTASSEVLNTSTAQTSQAAASSDPNTEPASVSEALSAAVEGFGKKPDDSASLEEQITQQVEWAQELVASLMDFVIRNGFQLLGAIVILAVGFWIGERLSRIIKGVCEKRGIDVTLAGFFGGFSKLLAVLITIVIALGNLGISIAPFIALLGAGAFGVTLAFAGPLSDYGAGLGLILSRPFKVGHFVDLSGHRGVVKEIKLSSTFLETEDGEMITIPNREITGRVLVNTIEKRIVEGSVGISYAADPEAAIAVVRHAVEGNDHVFRNPVPGIGIEAFADSSINIAYRFYAPAQRYYETMYEVNLAVFKGLGHAGIEIPFPQRDLHMKSMPPDREGASSD